MKFLDVNSLWHLFWILPFVLILILYAAAKRKKVLSAILGSRSKDLFYVKLSRDKRVFRYILLSLGIVLIMVGVARPSWGERLMPFVGRGRDVMIVLDISKSMWAEDIKPSRLEYAKWFIRQLIENSKGDRFGIIAFSGDAFLECPLTSDKTSFVQVLDDLSPDSIPLGGTNIQHALETAIKAFKGAETKHRGVVLISDGDELQGDSNAVLKQLKEMNVPLIVVGIGNPNKPGMIVNKDASGKSKLMRDKAGKLITTKLNEKQLSKLAVETNGLYVRSTDLNPHLAKVEDRIDELVPKAYASGKRSTPVERFHIPLIAGIILLLWWYVFSERSNRKVANPTLVFFLTFGLFMVGSHSSHAQKAPTIPAKPNVEDILKKTADKKPDKTIEKTAKTLPKKLTAIDYYNEALKLQQDKQVDKEKQERAKELYERAINNSKDNKVRGNAYQNLGVMIHADARKQLNEAPMIARKDLDGAIKKVDETMKVIDLAEDMYKKSLSAKVSVPKDKKSLLQQTRDIAKNQQKLLIDREAAKKLKKMIEELKKQQEKAQKKTQEAKNKQQKENKDQKKQKKQQKKKEQKDQNQQKQDKKQQEKKKDKQQKQQQKKDQQKQGQGQKKDQKQQQKKDQQKQGQGQKKDQKQQQKKDQQKQGQGQKKDQKQQQMQDPQKQGQGQKKDQQQKQQQQKSAKDLTDEAKKDVEKMKKQAQKLQNKQIEDTAKRAEKELDKAQKAQKQDKDKEAEDHLKKALKELQAQQQKQKQQQKNKDQKGKDQKDQKDQKKGQKDKKEDKGKGQKDQQKQKKDLDKKLPEKQAQPAKAKKGKEKKDIDKNQAEALLELMANDEKNLRDKLKANRKSYKVRGVEKDW